MYCYCTCNENHIPIFTYCQSGKCLHLTTSTTTFTTTQAVSTSTTSSTTQTTSTQNNRKFLRLKNDTIYSGLRYRLLTEEGILIYENISNAGTDQSQDLIIPVTDSLTLIVESITPINVTGQLSYTGFTGSTNYTAVTTITYTNIPESTQFITLELDNYTPPSTTSTTSSSTSSSTSTSTSSTSTSSTTTSTTTFVPVTTTTSSSSTSTSSTTVPAGPFTLFIVGESTRVNWIMTLQGIASPSNTNYTTQQVLSFPSGTTSITIYNGIKLSNQTRLKFINGGPAAVFGVYYSVDGGANFTLLQSYNLADSASVDAVFNTPNSTNPSIACVLKVVIL